MKTLVLTGVLAGSLCAGCGTANLARNGYGLRAVTECTADDGAKILLIELKGHDDKAVVAFLGKPRRKHDKEEYLYYPERADGSVWIAIVSFDESNRVSNVLGSELLPEPSGPPD